MKDDSLWSFYRSASPGTRKRLNWVGGAALVVLVTGIFTVRFLVTHLELGQREAVRENASVEPVRPQLEPFEAIFQIRRMNIALSNQVGNQVAYAQFDLVFDCPYPETKKELALYRAQLRDAVYTAAAGLEVESFRGPAAQKGFARFKDQILRNVRHFFPGEPPRDLVISNWVLQ